jgi:hypothetical protein
MEVRIGITQSARDLSFESSLSNQELTKLIGDAITSGAPLINLTDEKGRTILVPTAAISFVEIGTEKSRAVGFLS